jgi:hypothetical protein
VCSILLTLFSMLTSPSFLLWRHGAVLGADAFSYADLAIIPVMTSRRNARYHSQFEENTVVYSGVLATFVVAGVAVSMKPPSTLPARPTYMADLMNFKVADQFAVSFYTEGGPFAPG